jgi:hypothetical protein
MSEGRDEELTARSSASSPALRALVEQILCRNLLTAHANSEPIDAEYWIVPDDNMTAQTIVAATASEITELLTDKGGYFYVAMSIHRPGLASAACVASDPDIVKEFLIEYEGREVKFCDRDEMWDIMSRRTVEVTGGAA